MKFITSRDNAFFRQLAKLAGSAQERKAAGLTLLDGIHLISAYRRALGQPESLIVSKSGLENPEIKSMLAAQEAEKDMKVVGLADNLFREISPVKTPTGVMALVFIPKPGHISVQECASGGYFCLLLEAIQDPGNLGSILRSAAAAGAGEAYLSEGCADAWSPKALRAAMGAHFLLRIHERSDLAGVAKAFVGKVIATTLKAKTSLYQSALTGPVAFVFGNEGTGLSDEILAAVSEQVRIPMPGGTDSLNAAAAAAVCCFERVRQVGWEESRHSGD